MTAEVQKSDLGPILTTPDPLNATLLNTTPTPDTILLSWFGLELQVIAQWFDSFASRWLNLLPVEYLLLTTPAPLDAELLDTTPTPDTIFLSWEAFSLAVEPFYPGKATKIDPGTTLWVGDFFGYIG